MDETERPKQPHPTSVSRRNFAVAKRYWAWAARHLSYADFRAAGATGRADTGATGRADTGARAKADTGARADTRADTADRLLEYEAHLRALGPSALSICRNKWLSAFAVGSPRRRRLSFGLLPRKALLRKSAPADFPEGTDHLRVLHTVLCEFGIKHRGFVCHKRIRLPDGGGLVYSEPLTDESARLVLADTPLAYPHKQ